jgi:hypothetical protein
MMSDMGGADHDTWTLLHGGEMSKVERRADTVRRSTGPWTPATQALLRHLEQAGFDRAPRVVGADGDRELLTYLSGDVPDPRQWIGDEAAIVAAGEYLRKYHDATETFPMDAFDGWDPFFMEPAPAKREVICHNDFGVYNCVFVDGTPWGIIDFDTVAPGTRAWDLAGTAVSFVPFNPAIAVDDLPRRLRLLCDAYGLAERAEFPRLIEHRLALIAERLRAPEGRYPRQSAMRPFASWLDDVRHLVVDALPALEAALR